MIKGTKHSEDTKKKISEAKKKNPTRYWLGKTPPPLSKEARKKISKAQKGHKSYHVMVGEDNPKWKGDEVGYVPLHQWVTRHKGAPKKCEVCSIEREDKVYDWANIDHEYKRDLNDYFRVCRPCHRAYDKKYLQ